MIGNIENVIKMIEEKLYISKNEDYKNLYQELKEEYSTIIMIVIKGLTSKKLEQKEKTNFFNKYLKENIINKGININEYQEKIVTKLNDKEEIKGYSFLPTGLGNYENRKELMNQIIRQSTLEEKKYIYTYIELEEDEDITKVEQEIETLTKELKDTLLIITGECIEEEIPFILWSKKEESKEWIIRPPKEKEYSQFTHMGSKLEKLYKRERRDIFDTNVPYTRDEFKKFCNPHRLNTLLIYEQNNELLGFIEGEIIYLTAQPRLRAQTYMRINKFFVREDRRREKIGTRLFQELWKKAEKEKCDRIEVNVYNFTPEASKFFESLGLNILSYQYEIKMPKKY